MADGFPAGFGVLVTRPRNQARELADAVEARGGNAIVFPVLEIRPRPPADVAADAGRLPAPDFTVFISRNAVEHGAAYAGGRIAAIGPTTAEALRVAGRDVDIVPDAGFDSEHLLARPEFADLAGRIVRIVRGDPGRELLASEFERRGARVDYLQAYSRALPDVSPEELNALSKRWLAGGIGAVVVMSVQSLSNLLELVPAECRMLLAATPLVTPAARVLKELERLSPGAPAALAPGTGTADIVETLIALAGTPAPTD